ncbi:hypothetical protein HMPREF3181_00727 [Parvimonas sp. KA00067]|nr:hypothetical protein HMPREF3181_00727 [Parvimonas sp. KA00067]
MKREKITRAVALILALLMLAGVFPTVIGLFR